MALFGNLFRTRKKDDEKRGPLGVPYGPVRKLLSERSTVVERPRMFPDEHQMISPAGAGEIQGFIFRKKPERVFEDWGKVGPKWRKIYRDITPRIREILPPGAKLWEEPHKGEASVWFVKWDGYLSAVGIWPEQDVDAETGLPSYQLSNVPEKKYRNLRKKIHKIIQDYYDELKSKFKRGEKIF